MLFDFFDAYPFKTKLCLTPYTYYWESTNEASRTGSKFEVVEEDGKTYAKLALAIPGFSKEDIKIWLEENVLHIEGNIEKKKLGFVRTNKFDYSYTVSKNWDPTKTLIECENGILTLRIPQNSEEAAGKIYLLGKPTEESKS